MRSATLRAALIPVCGLTMLVLAGSAQAQVSREEDIGDIRLGQRITVDDGSCPAGQIKEVSGTNLTPAGVTRARKCVPRLGIKKR